MKKSTQTKGLQSRDRMSTSVMRPVDPDDLKLLVRDRLSSMTRVDREAFILALERELRSENVSMRAYLIPLGISASTREELTPGDVGHLVRFLKINVPKAMSAVDGVIERFAVFAEKVAKSGDRLAA
jgi:hypothetical protein